MSGILAPDVPAYVSYGLILLVAVFVSRRTLNELMATTEGDHWAFAGTWALFLVHLALPLALFWLLDYTAALNDTSIFAALVVAVGYRQIFAGGVQGIVLPGQTPALWKPFEAWVTSVARRIGARNKLYRDRFDARVQGLIARDDARLRAFATLVYASSGNLAALQAELAALAPSGDAAADRRRQVDVMWRDLRKREPQLYGWLLYEYGIVGWLSYWWWLEKGRPKVVSGGILLVLAAALVAGVAWFTTDPAGSDRQHTAWLYYYRWRFLKPSATDRDRWRSREYLTRELSSWGSAPIPPVERASAALAHARADLARARARLAALKPEAPEWAGARAGIEAAERAWRAALDAERRAVSAKILLPPLLEELRYPGIPKAQAAEILTLLVNCHSPALNALHVPELIESLRQQNETVRLETRNALLALDADYAGVRVPDALAKWEPRKGETPAEIDRKVGEWRGWWRAASAKYPGLAREP
jgi:hypothetical protein